MPSKAKIKASADADADILRTYELVGLIPGSLNDKDTAKAVDDVKAILAKVKAEITTEDLWQRRPLTYAIRGQIEASYFIADFTAPTSALKGLNKALRLESPLIRFSLVGMPEGYTYVSIATLQAQAAEAKEALAPGLEAGPKRRTATSVRAPRREAEEAGQPDSGKLDAALKNLDETL